MELIAKPLTRTDYSLYGDVISASAELKHRSANFGRAKRFDYLTALQNLRPQTARANLCVFSCTPWLSDVLEVKLLERHQFSTQVFLPMQDGRYLTIVALGGDGPDLSTISAFVIEGPMGISYRPGVWHYPMTSLDADMDLACLVFEDETIEDCEVKNLEQSVLVRL